MKKTEEINKTEPIFEKIKRLIPYIQGDFIKIKDNDELKDYFNLSFPCWESEGTLIPCISFWQVFENEKEYNKFVEILQASEYNFECITDLEYNRKNRVYNFELFPPESEKDNYNIEKILDDLYLIINSRTKSDNLDNLNKLNNLWHGGDTNEFMKLIR
jgi:hypothetical protein